jgi:hypothetical protein
VVLERIEPDIEGPIGSCDGIRIVPFEVLSDTIPDIYTLEEGVIAVVECSSVMVELVRKLAELVFARRTPRYTYHQM